MTRLFLTLIVAGLVVAVPATASAADGFKMPSRQTTCAKLGPAFYCSSTFIKQKAYDHMGVVRLGRSGKARVVQSGNDILLRIAGVKRNGGQEKRPVLPYGNAWVLSRFGCQSERTGLRCIRQGTKHGFLISRERQRYY
jgi:hypothetical protein